jgi:glycine betaine/choline ABC-type transport system substrate-binding protein
MKKLLGLCLALTLGLGLLSGCTPKSNDKEFIIIDGDFAEMNIFTHMAKLLIEEYTDFTVKIQPTMAVTLAYDQIRTGKMDLRLSYDGTLMATLLQLDLSTKPEGMTVYEYAQQEGRKKGVELLGKLGFENTYAVAVTKEVAQQYGLTKVSQLIPIADELIFGAEHQFFDEEGTVRFKPFTTFYGLEFADGISMDLTLKYAAMASGNIDVTLVYGTDGLNLKYELVVLEDDWKFFPEYFGAYLVRTNLDEEFPGVREALEKLTGTFTLESTIALNYQVDVDDKDPAEVARTYLKSKGLIQ